MKESVTYQAIVEKGMNEGLAKGLAEGMAEGFMIGAIEEARKLLLRLGQRRFDAPAPAEAIAAIQATHDLEKLEYLVVRLVEVSSWEELLGPTPKKSRRKRSSS